MKIFLADNSADVRLALQMLIDAEPGMDVIGIAVHTDGLVPQVNASKAEVLLLDCNLPGEPQSDLLAELHTMDPTLKVIALSIDCNYQPYADALEADAFFCKTASSDDLLKTLRTWHDEMRAARKSNMAVITSPRRRS